MKYLLLIAFVVSCASHHDDASAPGKVAYVPKAGDAYDTFVAEKGTPECVTITESKYCRQKSSNLVYYFKNNVLVTKLDAPKNPQKFEINLNSMSGEKFSTNKVHVTNGVKKLNPHSLEWRTHYPKIHKALTSAGLVVGTKGEKQVIRLTFGVKDLPENVVNRFVNFSGMNGEDEVWKLSVSSRGTSRDFARVLPVLLTASYDAVSEPGNESRSFVLSEEDLGVIAFTHHLAQ